MKRITTIIILSGIILFTTGSAFADSHKGQNREGFGRQEQSHRNDNKRNNQVKPQPPMNNHSQINRQFNKGKMPRDNRFGKIHPGGIHVYKHDFRPALQKMVRYVTRDARDINVWRINNDTFIVRYFRNGRYYTQKLYPYSGRYGAPIAIGINWSPQSFWMLLNSF